MALGATVSAAVEPNQRRESSAVSHRAGLRLLAALLALGAGAAAVVVGVLVIRGLPAVASTTTATAFSTGAAVTTAVPRPSAPAGYPTPPANAVVFGAQAGHNVLGLSVIPGTGRSALQASVVGQEGKGVKGLSVHFDVAGASGEKSTAAATPCGAGCYHATVAIAKPRTVGVRIGSGHAVDFALPTAWPAPSATAIVRRATTTWRKLDSVLIHDSLGDGRIVLNTEWKIVAPDRLEYHIQGGGGDAVIIGSRRWDKPRGTTSWLASPQVPLHQPVPFWQTATNAHVLGTVMSGGRPAWKVSFFDPKTPGWFTIVVDKATLRTTEMWMTAPAHFMHEVYGAFNTPISITPPA